MLISLEIGFETELAEHLEIGGKEPVKRRIPANAFGETNRTGNNTLKGKNTVASGVRHDTHGNSKAATNILIDIVPLRSGGDTVALSIENKGNASGRKITVLLISHRKINTALNLNRMIANDAAVTLVGSGADSGTIQIIAAGNTSTAGSTVNSIHRKRTVLKSVTKLGRGGGRGDRGRASIELGIKEFLLNTQKTPSAEVSNSAELFAGGARNASTGPFPPVGPGAGITTTFRR